MNKKDIKKQWEVISRGVDEIIGEQELKEKLLKGKKLRVKFGVDPTASDLHLGHTVIMEKLKAFQRLGHKIIFIIGDFTALIGDPSERDSTRPMLTKKEIQASVRNYKKQIFKILDTENIETVRNSSWLKKLGSEGVIKLASSYTVARMLERNDFSKRYEEGNPISITEFIYPLLQGYDSVVVKADIEIGGTDQKFNLLVGRHMQQQMGLVPQSILTMPLLEGTDGIKKMSKTYNNHISIDELPDEMFGRIMSISDDLMLRYYELLTGEDIEKVRSMHPMEAKKNLARILVSKYHSNSTALKSQNKFESIFSNGKIPEDIKIYKLSCDEKVVDVIYNNRILKSKAEVKRYINQGAVTLNGEKIDDINYRISAGRGGILKIGKRNFLKVK